MLDLLFLLLKRAARTKVLMLVYLNVLMLQIFRSTARNSINVLLLNHVLLKYSSTYYSWIESTARCFKDDLRRQVKELYGLLYMHGLRAVRGSRDEFYKIDSTLALG